MPKLKINRKYIQ